MGCVQMAITSLLTCLGDIYSMPVEGGEATILRREWLMKFSPNLVLTDQRSYLPLDAGGGDNIWVMNADGSDAKQ